jgi:hypothetical protein
LDYHFGTSKEESPMKKPVKLKKSMQRRKRSYLQPTDFAWVEPELFEIFFRDFRETVETIPEPGEYRKVGEKLLVGLKPDSPRVRGTIVFSGAKKLT